MYMQLTIVVHRTNINKCQNTGITWTLFYHSEIKIEFGFLDNCTLSHV